MDLSERLGWLLIGCVIGFILGYVVRALREIKEELDDVDQCVKKCRENHEHIFREDRKRDERGIVRFPLVADILLLGVIALTVWAAFASQAASNQIEDQQKELTKIAYCNQQYLRAQADFLSVYLETPPATDLAQREALEEYFYILDAYADSSNESPPARHDNVDSEALSQCIQEGDTP